MHSTSTLLCSATLALSLAACAGDIDTAERLAPPADAFAAALQSGYVALARAELAESDLSDSHYFAARALQSASGSAPPPSTLSERLLPSGSLPALAAARERLAGHLGRGVRASAAVDAARAQLSFDCWMQEQEENIQPRDIAACRQDFESAMTRLDLRQRADVPAKQTRLPVRPVALTGVETHGEAVSALKTRYTVYFNFDAHRLTPDAEGEVAKAAAAARLTGAAMVRVVGHADRAGPGNHNMTLSRSRAHEVVGALRRLGLPDVGVAAQALGEEQPAIKTPDGARERRNRRVVIELTH